MSSRPVMLALIALLGSQPALVWASDYPTKPIRMIVGFPPGGGADIIARLIAERASEELKTQIVLDNRPGAGSSTAMGLAAQASPDGYTLLFATTGLTINPAVYKHVPYDPLNDFAPVGQVASSPFVLVVREAMAANSIRELIAIAKAKPGALNYSSGGNGSTGHLSGELFKSMAGIDLQHIPYKGLAPALTDLLGGRVDMTMSSLPPCMAYIKSRRLKALAITTATRMPFVPDIPTMSESGVPGYNVEQWYGVLSRAGTPREAVTKFHKALERALGRGDEVLTERFAALGTRVIVTSPAEFDYFIRENLALWKQIVKIAGAKAD